MTHVSEGNHFMSQTLATGLALTVCLITMCWSSLMTLRLAHQSFAVLKVEHHAELEAHRCGRALAAIANIQIEAVNILSVDRKNPDELEPAVRWLSSRIEQSISNDVELSATGCRIVADNRKGVRLYRFDRFHIHETRPNFTYKLNYDPIGGRL